MKLKTVIPKTLEQPFIDWIAEQFIKNQNGFAEIAIKEFVTTYPEYKPFLQERIKFHAQTALEVAQEQITITL